MRGHHVSREEVNRYKDMGGTMRRALLVGAIVCSGAMQVLWGQFVVPRPMRTVVERPMRSGGETSRDTLRMVMPEHGPARTEGRDRQALEFAHTIALDVSPRTHGQWILDAEGNVSWQLTLHTPRAESMGLRLEEYEVPEGGAIYIYGNDGRVRGAFTEQHRLPGGLLQLAPVAGSSITIVYEAPAGSRSTPTEAPFRITQLTAGHTPLPHLRLDRGKYGFDQGEPYFDPYRRTIPLYACAPGVVAYPEYAHLARSVVMLIADGKAVASGALINNVRGDGTAYVLTSAHCINGIYDYPTDLARIRQTVASMVFFFSFQSPSADTEIRPTEELSLSGAELVHYEPESDVALLRITGLPTDAAGVQRIPASYNPYFAGWSLSITPTAPYLGIHHPYGMTKRVSIVEGSISIEDYLILLDYPWEDKHWNVKRWAVGATAAGSSGSPLFDAEGRVIGALSGGRSSCTNPEDDSYWSLQRVWNGVTATSSLRKWLDPDGTGVQAIDGLDPHAIQPIQRLGALYATSGQSLRIHTTQELVTGVGYPIRLTAQAKPLGVFVVFAGNEALQNTFPQLTAELRQLSEDGRTLSEPVWSGSVSSANYHRYNATTGTFDTNTRTLAYDTVELFIPGLSEVTLPEGRYVLGVRTADDTSLSLPLMYRTLRTTMSYDRPSAWIRTLSGWQQDMAPHQYWIDLLLEGSMHPKLTEDTTSAPYVAYYHGGQLYVRNPHASVATLYLYSLDGKLIAQHLLNEGETILPINRVPETSLIALIRGRVAMRTLSPVTRSVEVATLIKF